MSLSPPGVELGAPKICHSRFTLELNTDKSIDYIENSSIKSFSKLNFLQKPYRAHMSISPNSGAAGLQRFAISTGALDFKNGKSWVPLAPFWGR